MKLRSLFLPLMLSAVLLGCGSKENPAGAVTPVPTVSSGALEGQDFTGNSSDDASSDAQNQTSGTDKVPQNDPTPTTIPTPTPIIVNTDTSTVTYLVNREYPLTEDFVPEGLMTPDILFPFSDTTIDKAKMVPVAAYALDELFDAAFDEEHLVLYGVSAYRSFTRQYTIYATNLAVYGTAHSNRYSAAPGTSEHQTGLVIDISCRSEGFDLEETFADTPEGKWVAANAHRFGFIIRYPKGKESITGYSYEPWHLRYVGMELAAYLYETGLTLDEYYGVPCTLTEEYLNTTPLIDTTTERYQSIYRQYH